MQYKPKKPLEGVNSSVESPLSDAVFLTLLTAGVVCVGITILIVASSYLVRFFSIEMETKYFQSEFKEDRGEDEKRLQELVNSLWASFPESEKTKVHVSISKAKEVNAYMAPGGNMTVTQGLLDNLEYENEIAFVVCHELGHFYNRDVVRGLSRRLSVAVVLSFIGIGDSLNILGKGSESIQLVFDRSQESKADEFALQCMDKYYGHVQGYDAFFKHAISKRKLGKTSRKFLSFMQTHPLTEDRIKKLSSIIEKLSLKDHGEIKAY